MKLVLYSIDFLASLFAFFASYYLRNFGPFRAFLDEVQPLSVYLAALPFAIILLLVVFKLNGMYEEANRLKPFTELFLIARSSFTWILLIMAGSYLYKYDYSRIIVILYFFFTLAFVSSGRALLRFYEQSFGNLNKLNILIVGTGKNARDLAKKLRGYVSVGYNILGFVGDKGKFFKEAYLGSTKNLNSLVRKLNVDEVYISDPSLSKNQILELISKSSRKNVSFKVVSDVFSLISGQVDITQIESIPSLELWKPSQGWWVGTPKRVLDLTLSTLLIIFTLPIWFIIAVSIYAIDGRPIIHLQKRVGYKGKIFKMYKFRTMVAKGKSKKVTKIGRVLRKTSLDELPQLVNVIKGEMSLVGPRPEIPQKASKHKTWQKKRLEVKPGLTGLWQVLGRKDLPLSYNLEYDFYYINKQSFMLDMVIILKTIPVVLFGKGAY